MVIFNDPVEIRDLIKRLGQHATDPLVEQEIDNLIRWINKNPLTQVGYQDADATLTELDAGPHYGDTTGGAFITYLPTAVGHLGLTFIFKYYDGAAAWTIATNGAESLDDILSIDLEDINDCVIVRSDNVNWIVIASMFKKAHFTGGTIDGATLGGTTENTINPDSGLVSGYAYNKWSNMQDHLFKYEPPVGYRKSDISADMANADVFGYSTSCVWNGYIVFGIYNTTAATDKTGAKIVLYKISDGTWSYWTKATMGLVNADVAVCPIAVAPDGTLYIGTYNTTAATDGTASTIVTTTDGATFTRYTKATMGGAAADTYLGVLNSNAIIVDGSIYIGTYNTTAATDATGAKFIKRNLTTGAWSTVTKATMGANAADIGFCGCLWTVAGTPYAVWGTYNTTAATDATGSKLVYYNRSTLAWSVVLKSAISGAVAADQSLGRLGSIGTFRGRLWFGCYNTTAATDATACKIFMSDGTYTYFAKNPWWQINATTTLTWGFIVYDNAMFIGANDTTAATNFSGAQLMRFNPWDSYYAERWTKAGLPYGANADVCIIPVAVANGYLWCVSYNTTAAVDGTSGKIWKIKLPIAHSLNDFMSKGF